MYKIFTPNDNIAYCIAIKWFIDLSKITLFYISFTKKFLESTTTLNHTQIDFFQGETLTSLGEAIMFNIVMVGDSSVGKTSFIRRLERGEFLPDPSATLGE